MPVSTTHPDYDDMVGEWKLVKAATKGQKEVKKLKTEVLPAPGCKDGSYDKARYNAYIERAIYTNITGRTLAGLVGAAFRQEPQIELPTGLEYLEVNADGGGLGLDQVAKRTLSNLIKTGREILLVDYPEIEEGLTQEQFEMLEPQAFIKRYAADCLINWRTTVIDGREVLSLAVLSEPQEDYTDEFQSTEVQQYRVLRLTADGYSQQLYEEEKPITTEVYPVKSTGERFAEIPLVVSGSQYNDVDIDPIPLADIAYLNIGHFRNSADLEENAFIHGQMTLGVTSDLSSDEWAEANPNGIVVGSMSGHFLGSSGGFHTAQTEENQIADKLQERKEGQMLALGARLVEQRNPQETAAAAKLDATGQNSVLGDLVNNVESALNKCLAWAGMFMGEDGEYVFSMNREFFPDSLDPQLLMAAIQGYDRSVIAKSDLQDSYRKSGVVSPSRTNDDINEENGEASPLE